MCQERALLEFTPDNPLYLDLQQPAALKLAVKGLKSITVKAREGQSGGGGQGRGREGAGGQEGQVGKERTPDNPLYLGLQQPAALKLAVKGLKSITVKAREGQGTGREGFGWGDGQELGRRGRRGEREAQTTRRIRTCSSLQRSS